MPSIVSPAPPAQLARPPLPTEDERWALWLDIDGTIVGPGTLSADGRMDILVVALLGRLREQLDGAFALLTHRSIDQLDRLCAPIKLPAAALYGAQLRDARGHLDVAHADHVANAQVGSKCNLAGRLWREVDVEHKGGICHVLRYPASPRVEASVREFASSVADGTGGEYEAKFASGVAVLKPSGPSKGKSLHALARTAPFAGRRPVFIGDETTDEAAFRAAAALGGFGVLVGARRPTCASFNLDEGEDTMAWLRALSRRLDWA
jgi:trehalose 6-phosphate phosphatase